MSRNLLLNLAVCMAAVCSGFETRDFVIADSEIYPGTTHSVTVTLSENYRPDSTAILYLGLDGVLCRAPQVFDSLDVAGVIKPVVGVFLQPGVITDSISGRVLRYNRSNEFDAITPKFARFLEEEVLPAVKAQGLNWSPAPDDHLIFGLSSGGIAAFNAAWHRPQMWGKVFSGCGTYVPMRGGQDIQVLVRKTEPKPIKVVLQDGYSDTWNPLFGSWYEANRMLASALEFAGYDCRFDWAEGGHSVRRASEIFPETVEWLLFEPANPKPTGNNCLAPLLVEGRVWEESVPESTPQPCDFIDYPGGGLRIRKDLQSNVLLQSILTADGSESYTQPFYWLHSLDGGILAKGGMDFDSHGNLWIVTSAGIQILDQNGRVRGIINLPSSDLDIAAATLTINEGMIRISDGRKAFVRHLNVVPAVTLPLSQGQG